MTESPNPQNVAAPTPAPATPAAAPAAAHIQYDDFAKVQFRVATILEAAPVEKSKKLMRLQVDLGDEKRQILAGIKEFYTAEALVGKQIVVVVNLAPREVIKGEVSNGMLLAASDGSGKLCVISPSDAIAPGASVR